MPLNIRLAKFEVPLYTPDASNTFLLSHIAPIVYMLENILGGPVLSKYGSVDAYNLYTPVP